MDIPVTTITLDKEQAALFIELIQRDICSSQRHMKLMPDERERLRKRIIQAQALRRQIPECYWR